MRTSNDKPNTADHSKPEMTRWHLEQDLTQEAWAERMRTKQSAISRLKSGSTVLVAWRNPSENAREHCIRAPS